MKKRVSIIALALILVLAFVALGACDIAKTYKIDIQEAVGGKVTSDCIDAKAGTQITLTLTADEGYLVSSVKANNDTLTVVDGKATFVMPEEDVVVVAEFIKGDYTVSIAKDIAHGKVVASAVGGNVGDTITLTVTPDFGYKLASLKADNKDVVATNGVYSFVMPGANVVVTATFDFVDDAVTSAVPEGGIELTADAVAGAKAKAVATVSYHEDGVKFVAYVLDSAITAKDGVAFYVGTKAYANGGLTAANKGVVASIESISVVGVADGKYATVDANVNAAINPWVVSNKICGYVVEICVPYATLGTTKADAENNTTAIFALTNCDKGTLANTAVYADGDVNDADTYAIVNADGTLSTNQFKFGVGQLGQGETAIETGRYWDLSQDYGKDDANYADRKAVLSGHDGADNNLAMYRATGKNVYAKATFTLTGINGDERWGKFGIMLFDGKSQQGFFFYVDAFVGVNGDVSIDNVNGTSLGYNSATKGWGSWTTLPGTNGAFNLETKTITLAISAYNGMIFMYHNDKLVGEMGYDLGDDAVVGFKSFAYDMEVTDYTATNDVNDPDFIAHRRDVENQKLDVLFLGDSYMDFWRSSGFDAHTAAIKSKANIGIGGTKVDEWTAKVAYIQKMYTPSNFVFHIGVNDIDDGNTTAEVTFDRFKNMIAAYKAAFPDADIYWVSLVHNTMFAGKAGEYDKMNAYVKAYADEIDNLHYIDVSAVGMDEEGNTRVNMMYDGLHFNAEYGYPAWGKLIMNALGYTERAQGTTLGDIGDIYAYNQWTFSTDGTVAKTNVSGEQAIWAKDMEYTSDFIFTVDVKSTSVLAGDAWSKIGLTLRNDNYSIFAYVDTPTSTAAENRKWCGIVYRPNGNNQYGIYTTADWLWNAQGSFGAADRLVESDFVTLGVAKIGGTIYMLADGKVVSTHTDIANIADQKFVAGVLSFNRTVEAKNAKVETGTQNELLVKLGLKGADAELDGNPNESIWTTEVIGNTVKELGKRGEGSYVDFAAVKGSDGVYGLATIYHKQSLTSYAQGDGTAWFNWLNIEFRFGNDGETQRAIYFENGVVKSFGGIVVGDYVTTAAETEGGLNKTVVEFFAPYKYFPGYTAESDEIPIKFFGWVAETGWTTIETTPTVSTHGLRYEHTIVVNGNATLDGIPTTARKGDEISFTVALADGLTLKSVKIGETVLTANDGVYTFTMPDANVTVVVEIDGRRNVDLAAVEGKVNVVGTPDQGSQIQLVGVAPWNITKLMVNGKEVEATDGKYMYTVGTEDIVVTAEFIVVTDEITIDGLLEPDYGTAQSFNVEGNRDVKIYAKKTTHGVVLYLVAHSDTNVTDFDTWYLNHNLEFLLNEGDQCYVNSRKQSSGVTAFTQSATLLESGKWEHVYEVFVAGNFDGNVQLNYAFKAPGEAARYEGMGDPTWERSDWWNSVVGGVDAAKKGLYGQPAGRPANLFITEDGLLCTRPTAQNATIDADFSEYAELASITRGNENAKFTFTGKTASDGYYLAITILQKQRAAATPEWHLNDNLEIVLFGNSIGFSIFDNFICAHGAVTQYAMNRTTIDQDGYTVKTDIELFVYDDAPAATGYIKVGCNGNGFGGWQSLVWDGADRIKLTAGGATFVQEDYKAHALNTDNVTLDGNLNDDFWNGVTVYNNAKCQSYSDNGVYALVQAKKGSAGIYLAVTMYHHKAYSEVIQGDGSAWWNYLNIEFRFPVNGAWDTSLQRAVCPQVNGELNCTFGWTSVANTDEGLSDYQYKTVFEIFTPYEWAVADTFAIKGDIPLWIACVAEKGYVWLLEFNQDQTLPTVLTNDGFVRK